MRVLDEGEVRQVERVPPHLVAHHLAGRIGDGEDGHPELAQFRLVPLERAPERGEVLLGQVGGNVLLQFVEAGGMVSPEEGGEKVDPALEFGHGWKLCSSL